MKKAYSQIELEPMDWDAVELSRKLAGMSGRRILVVGDVGVDRYTHGLVERISPEAPVPIVFVQEEKLKLGLASNVADNVRTLGAEPCMVGVIGEDRCAQDLKQLFKHARISDKYLVKDKTRRTVMKERVVSDRQQLLRIDYESTHPVSSAVSRKLLATVTQALKKCDAVILEDYAKGMLSRELMQEIIRRARSLGKYVAVDPNRKTPAEFYKGATVLTPNTKEAEALSGIRIECENSLWKAAQVILKRCQARHVVITRGKDGMTLVSAGQKHMTHIRTVAREVYDVSGAGDTVIAVLTVALAAGASLNEACILGNLAAGVEVGKRGTATVSPEEILLALEFNTRGI